MMLHGFVVILAVLALFTTTVSAKSSQTPCKWDSKAGAHYDLRSLMLNDQSTAAYTIKDGDIPCTPEIEPTYGYSWNFCADMPKSLTPDPCKKMGKNAVVLQYAQYSATEYYCFIIGHYDSNQHELTYNFLDARDPTKGMSIRYPAGEKCSATNPKPRSATIDVQCANVDSVVVSATEPTVCDYHMIMKSYRGCPTECPVTSNGLCDSHGHCAYDNKAKQAYCYCNEGYGGSACSSKSTGPTTYDGYSVQLGLLITLLIVAMGLTGGTVYLSYRVAQFRKDQVSAHYSSLPGGENEMVTTVNFR